MKTTATLAQAVLATLAIAASNADAATYVLKKPLSATSTTTSTVCRKAPCVDLTKFAQNVQAAKAGTPGTTPVGGGNNAPSAALVAEAQAWRAATLEDARGVAVSATWNGQPCTSYVDAATPADAGFYCSGASYLYETVSGFQRKVGTRNENVSVRQAYGVRAELAAVITAQGGSCVAAPAGADESHTCSEAYNMGTTNFVLSRITLPNFTVYTTTTLDTWKQHAVGLGYNLNY